MIRTVNLLFFLCVGAGLAVAIYRTPKASLYIENQLPGEYFVVKEMTLTKPGFVVIYKANNYHKLGDEIVGIRQQLFPPGRYSDVHILRYNQSDKPKSERSNAAVSGGTLYFAVLYEDSDHNTVLSSGDRIMTDWLGREMMRPFMAR
ncbi:hypothetical protein HY086_03960 [Candidatus Gottesmanbacteria bacterium]|nr:hypothetical protein [Candidatus Gottesmanbacteria bacterium]